MIAKIRTVKPEVFVHGLLFDLERITGLPMRLSYIGLWCWTDRAARFEWKPRELKTGIMPHDDLDFEAVLNVLANAGFIVKYQVAGRVYGWVPRFLDHQNINGRETASRIPEQPADAVAIYERALLASNFHSLDAHALLSAPAIAGAVANPNNDNELTRGSRVADPSSSRASRDTTGREGKGREVEGKGREKSSVELTLDPTAGDAASGADDPGSEGASAPLTRSEGLSGAACPIPEPVPEPPNPSGALVLVDDQARNVPALPAVRGERTAVAVQERMALVMSQVASGERSRMRKEQLLKLNAELVFIYWTARFDHPRAILDAKRETRIVARLKENGGDVSELLYALDGASRDPFIMGEEGGKRFDGIETVLRDRGQVERFAGTRKKYRDGIPHPALAKLEAAASGDSAPEVS